jgi:hypothetical protein
MPRIVFMGMSFDTFTPQTTQLIIIASSVNLGGWFVLEPFITPALYQKYPGAVDEWTLSTLMAADTASGGLNQIEDHYKTFIVSIIHISLLFKV